MLAFHLYLFTSNADARVLNGQGQLTAQAAWIQDFITTRRTLSGAGPAFIYTTRPDTRSSNPQDTCGVYRTDWTPKPAADVIKDLA